MLCHGTNNTETVIFSVAKLCKLFPAHLKMINTFQMQVSGLGMLEK